MWSGEYVAILTIGISKAAYSKGKQFCAVNPLISPIFQLPGFFSKTYIKKEVLYMHAGVRVFI